MIIKFEDLKDIRMENKNKNIAICSGWFDLFHVGHLNYLKNAKENCDILIVFLRSDEDGKIVKGDNRPFINENDRGLILDSLKFVDYVIIGNQSYDIFKGKGNNLKDELRWLRYMPIINELNPNIVFYLKESIDCNSDIPKWISNKNIDICYLNRYDKISTTDIEHMILYKNENN